MQNPSQKLSPEEIKSARSALAQSEPGLRARDLAEKLGISEGELVAARVGEDVRRLKPEWAELLNGLPAVGRVMSLVRNDSVVHERKGVFENVKVPSNTAGIVLGEDIDLRLFMKEWHAVFLVEEETRSGLRRSVQIFDHSGTAVEKIYLLEDSDEGAFDALMDRLTDDDQHPGLAVSAYHAGEPAPLPSEETLESFRLAWANMTDVHQLFGILKKHGLDRKPALEAVGQSWARRVDNSALRQVLEAAAEREIDIMVFVGNRGMIQIHTGTVKSLKAMGPWFNVLDPDFNLHAREDHIAECWAVRKPTSDGMLHSLEIFDTEGRIIVQMFGRRKEGQPEDVNWRAVIEGLPSAITEAAE